jgi:tetratricopeptide (TPR) repeat protein
MFLSAYMQQEESAYLRGLQKLNEVKHSPWEGEPIGIASNCGSYFMMARLAETTGHLREASQFTYEAAQRGYGYYNSNIWEFEHWHEQYRDYPYFSLAYALYLHHATSYDTGNSLLKEANDILDNITPSFYENPDYWWVMGLVNERLQDWEKVEMAGKKLVKMNHDDMRGHYLLFRFYGASTPKFNQKKSEEHRVKYAELKAEKRVK